MSVDEAVAKVIASYEAEAAKIDDQHRELVDDLVSKVDAAGGVDVLDRYFGEGRAELKDELGSRVLKAMAGERPSDQNAAVSRIGSWVDDIVGNDSTRATVLADIFVQGAKEVAFLIPEEIVAVGRGPKTP